MSKCVKLRGLPWEATEEDIRGFLEGCDVAKVQIVYNHNQKPTGEAFITLASKEGVEEALKQHRKMLGRRYVEVFPSSESEAMRALMHKGGSGGRKFSDHGDGTTLKMRGLPFDSKEEDIIQWYSSVDVQPIAVHLGVNSSHRPSGEAFVQFRTVDEANKAKTLHMQSMGSRYIELFNCSEKDLAVAARRRGGRQARRSGGNRSAEGEEAAVQGSQKEVKGEAKAVPMGEVKPSEGRQGNPPVVGNLEGIPDYFGAHGYSPLFMGGMAGAGMEGMGHMKGGNEESTIVHIKGMDPRMNEQDVAKWLSEAMLTPTQVHMVYAANNIRTGEAYVDFSSVVAAKEALKLSRQNMGESYVELVPASYSEMMHAMGAQMYGMQPSAQSPMFMHYGLPNMHMWGGMHPRMMDGYGGEGLWQQPPFHATQPMYGGMNQAMMPGLAVPQGEMGPEESFMAAKKAEASPGQPGKRAGDKKVSTLRLRGLPYRATVEDVLAFFEGYEVVADMVRMGRDRDGRASGECWVSFGSEEEASRAQRERNKEHIGDRYVEIFRD